MFVQTKYKNLCANAALLRIGSGVATALTAEVLSLKKKIAEREANAAMLEKHCQELDNNLRYMNKGAVAWARRELESGSEFVSLWGRLPKVHVECANMRCSVIDNFAEVHQTKKRQRGASCSC